MTITKFSTEKITLKVQALLAAAQEAGEEPGMKPEWSTADLGFAFGEWSNYYYTFALKAARHTGVRIKVSYSGDRYVARVLGFAHDVAFFDLLYTSIVQAFSSKLEPRYDPTASPASNALRLRQGGMERARIAKLIFAERRMETLNEQKAANRGVTKLIKEQAASIGQPELAEEVLGRSFNAKVYRESYARGFLDQLATRLMTLSLSSAEGGLVLKKTKEEVDEAWYQEYPADRPAPSGTVAAYTPCAKCAKAKSGSCRDHSFRKPKEQAINWSAVTKGRRAVSEMNLGTVRGRAL